MTTATLSLGAQLASAKKGTQLIVPELRSLLTTTGAWVGADDPLVPPVRYRPQRLRDVIPSAPVAMREAGLVPYVRELHVIENEGGASAVAEASAKPEVTIEFEGDEEHFGKVSAWVPATDDVIADGPGLDEYVKSRLGVLLDVREDAQILNGTGLPGYDGILQVAGRQTQTAAATKAETITAALRKVDDVEGRATAVVVNASDYWDIFDDDPTFWEYLGVPAVRTRAMAVNKALVGDFVSGAALRDKDAGVRVKISESHSDYFIKNKQVVLAERRSLLIVRAPALFVEATLS